MRASRPGISLSLSPSATAVFDPAKLCLPSSPAVNGSMPYIKFNYFVDIILATASPRQATASRTTRSAGESRADSHVWAAHLRRPADVNATSLS